MTSLLISSKTGSCFKTPLRHTNTTRSSYYSWACSNSLESSLLLHTGCIVGSILSQSRRNLELLRSNIHICPQSQQHNIEAPLGHHTEGPAHKLPQKESRPVQGL